jgi:hypothetical protein
MPNRQTVTIERRQRLFLDGMKQSILMARIAYSRLIVACQMHVQFRESMVPQKVEIANELLSQTWLIVDSSNRLRRLAISMPGLQRTDAVKAMLHGSAEAWPLRNYIQHLDTDLMSGGDSPLWGTLRWTEATQHEQVIRVAVHYYVAGPVAAGPVDLPFQVGRGPFRHPIDDFTLAAAGTQMNITSLVESLQHFGERLELALDNLNWPNENERIIVHVPMERVDTEVRESRRLE